MNKNPDRLEVPQIPIGDTTGPEWLDTGRTIRMPLPVQLTPGQIVERQREGRELRREARARYAEALSAKSDAAKEFKAASIHLDDVSNKCAVIDQEVETERTMREGKVQLVHRYPDTGGLGFEVLVRQDPGYENMRHGDERALKAEEWAEQASVPGTVTATEPTAEFLALVRAAVEQAREALDPGATPDELVAMARELTPGLDASDLLIAAVCVELRTDETIVRTLGAVAAGGRQITAVELLDAMGGGNDREFARTRLEALISDGTVAVLDAGDTVCIELADPHETPESQPVSDADDEPDHDAGAKEPLDDLVLDILRTPSDKWQTNEDGAFASAGQIRKRLPSENLATLAEIGASLKRLLSAHYVNQVPGTRSYQSAIVE